MQISVQSWTSPVITQLSVSRLKGSSEENPKVLGYLYAMAQMQIYETEDAWVAAYVMLSIFERLEWCPILKVKLPLDLDQAPKLRPLGKRGSREQGPWSTEWWVASNHVLLVSSCPMVDHLVNRDWALSLAILSTSFLSREQENANRHPLPLSFLWLDAPETEKGQCWPHLPCDSEGLHLPPCLTVGYLSSSLPCLQGPKSRLTSGPTKFAEL